MQNFLTWAQIIVCAILIISVLFQDSKNNNHSMSNSANQAYFKPRGKEAFLNNITKISGFSLFVISIASLIIK